jgi:hypothetical protein
MHTLALRGDDDLSLYIDAHEGFRGKTELITAALEHFRNCQLSKFRNVADGQYTVALAETEDWLDHANPAVDASTFLHLLESIAISCRIAHRAGATDIVKQVAHRHGVSLTGSSPGEHLGRS